MDKETYENFEYLSASSDADGNQLLVVQEDGTFLCFNRPIQYVTQVDDGKEVIEGVQPCDVYNIAPQHLYIDGTNSTELISVSDQFAIPDGENNIYTNNYLLQDHQNPKEAQMDQEAIQYKDITESEETIVESADVDTAVHKTVGDCTEITLSDEQYQVLEQKGWILLECTDKIFLLDNTGLHDITADERLIQKLKFELQADNNNTEEVSSSIKQEIKLEHLQTDAESTGDDLVHYYVEDDGVVHDEGEINNFISNVQEISRPQIIEEQDLGHEEEEEEEELSPIESEHDYVKLNSVKDSFIKRDNDTLRIKTKFSFKDIPPEIVLGKFNGKKLVARVVKTEKPMDNSKLGSIRDLGNNTNEPCYTGLEDSKFENLLREAVRGTIECGVKDVTDAENVVGQLLRVPAFKPAVIERRLIITKMILLEDEATESYSESSPSLVTGRAVKDGNHSWHFKFIPDMIRRLTQLEEGQCDDVDFCSGEDNDFDFLHIHIRETKAADGITRISITLNRRHIPLQLFSDMKLRHPKTIFACSACATVYKTEEGLQLHRETECMITDDGLTIDTEKTNVSYTIVNTSKGKQYVCNVCNIVFTKLVICQEHVKTHFDEENVSDNEISTSQLNNEDSKRALGLFRCKMCNRAYFHASTLSKHIVSRHIKHMDVN